MIYSKQTLNILKESVDKLQVLMEIGGLNYNDISDRSNEYRSPCPIHGGDNKMAFCWSKSYDGWKCFTRQCESKYSNDVFGFIQAKTGCSFKEAVQKVADMCNYDLTEADFSSDQSEYDMILETIKSNNVLEKSRIKDIAVLQELPNFYNHDLGFELIEKYIQTRNYNSLAELKKYNLYPFLDWYNQLRIGIPSYTKDGKLVGVNARTLDSILDYGSKNVPKYLITPGYKKENVLFNLNNTKLVTEKDYLLIVEGEFSCIRLCHYGWVNSVACLGTTLSMTQITLSIQNSLNLHFLIERGKAAREGFINTLKKLKQAGLSVVYYSELIDKDPDEAPFEELEFVINSKKELRIDEVLTSNNIYKIFKYE